MKKILFALVAIALVFTSCDPTNGGEEGEGEGAQFEITVSDITAHEANVSVVPSDKAIPYFTICYDATQIEGMSNDELAADLYDYIEAMMDYYAELYAMFGQTYDPVWADFCFFDDFEDAAKGLEGSTSYTVVAMELDTINKTHYTVAKKTFTTLEAPADEEYLYEPQTATTFSFAPTAITGQYYDSYECFYMNITDASNDYTLCLGANYQSAEPYREGTFLVNMDAEAAGSVWGSAGFDGTYVYRTFLGELDEDGYIAGDAMYFVTAGSMTISQTGMTANLTTKYGTTVTVNFEGEIDWEDMDAQGAPAKIRRAPQGPRMFKK